MKIGIVGSRSFDDYNYLEEKILNDFEIGNINLIISGGAGGADTLGIEFAEKHCIKTKIFKPDWKRYGEAAGPIRNEQIVEEADVIIAFWDGESKGTKDTIDKAVKNSKNAIVHKYR